MSPRLKQRLQDARGRNSLNQEIVERLELTLDDSALKMVGLIRPFLTNLDEEERAKAFDLMAAAVDIIAKGAIKKP